MFHTKKSYLWMTALMISTATALFAETPKPIYETTYKTDSSGKFVLDNIEPAVNGTLTPGATIIDTPIGKAMQLTRKLNNGLKLPASPKLELGNDFTISCWLYSNQWSSKESERAYRSQIYFSRSNWRLCCDNGQITMETYVGAKKHFFKLMTQKQMFAPKQWIHVAFVYSPSEKNFRIYLNGEQKAVRKNSVKIPPSNESVAPYPAPEIKPVLFGSLGHFFPFDGKIGRIRIYDKALTPQEVTEAERDIAEKLLNNLKDEAGKLSGNGELLKKINTLIETKNFQLKELLPIQRERDRLMSFKQFKDSVKGNLPLAYSVVDPLGPEVFFRDSALPQAGLNGKILIAAAQNEYEPASFLVKPLEDIDDFLPGIGELKSKNGERISPEAFDILLVKQIVSLDRMLKPNALIHDDNMLKVDPDKGKMWLRLNFKEGIKYLDVTTDKVDNISKSKMTLANYPLYDSKKILPVNLKSGVNQQYWLTLKTAKNMKPGLYESKIKLTGKGKTLATIPLKVRILPFTLPQPKTNYDLKREFTTAVYFFDVPGSGIPGAVGSINHTMPQNEQQFRATLRNLKEHGINHPTIIMGNYFPGWDSWRTKAPRSTANEEQEMKNMAYRLNIMKELGFPLKPLYLHTGGNIGFREFYKRSEHQAMLKDFITRGNALYRKILGHDEIYHYGLDEAEGERLVAEYEVWEDMAKYGAKVYTTIKKANTPLVAGRIAIAIAVHQPEKAMSKLMHDNGGQMWVYAQPFARPGNGYAHRKGYGYGVYFADYDGICNYSFNHWGWQTVPWSMYNVPSAELSYVMPKADGVVDTPGWEGYREGIDDVRYATKLRIDIDKALKGNNMSKKQIARQAENYLNTVNIDSPEFNASWTRYHIIDYILELNK